MTPKLTLATVFVFWPALSYATVAYNSFLEPGDGNSGVTLNVSDQAAQEFTSLATGQLTSLMVGLGVSEISTPPNPTDIFLYADDSGIPGALLESWSSVDAGAFSFSGNLVIVNSVVQPILTSGQVYWVGVQTVDNADNPIIWYFGTGSNPDTDIFFQGAWVAESPTPFAPLTLQVNVSPVPEPTGWVLLGAGLIGMVMKRRWSTLPRAAAR